MMPIAGLVLAAGESRRMGTDKALLEYRRRPFLEVVLENLRNAGITRRIVVLGYHADEIRSAVRLADAEVVDNPQYRLGQTSSLQAGLRAIEASGPSGVAGVLLCLVDHPAATAQVMREIIQISRETGAPVVIPVIQGRRGHPVLISRALFPELLELDPRQGANTVVRKYRDATCFLEVHDRGVLLDVDRPEDYRALKNDEL